MLWRCHPGGRPGSASVYAGLANIPRLQRVTRFGGWLKRIAINVWLQHLRKNDPLKHAEEYDESGPAQRNADAVALDLDSALAALPDHVRLCIVLSYNEGMSHEEIKDLTDLPLGTVKSRIHRGTLRLQKLLSAYANTPAAEISS